MLAVPTTKDTKALIDRELKSLFATRVAQAAKLSPHYETLWQTIEQVSLAGGKRLRPYLTLLAYQAWGGQTSGPIIKAALAQELVHLSLLIHDDIIDRDINRHGQLNMTGHFLDIYAEFLPNIKERRHYAESAALLAGNLLISEAHYQLAHAGRDELHEAFFAVIGGELLDTEGSFRHEPVDPLIIATYKTASYSFAGPLKTGAILADAPKAQRHILNSFAEQLGIGFQLRDDLIGTFGTQASTGKSVDGDIREGKHTFLIEAFYKQANPREKTAFDAVFGKAAATNEEVQTARDLLTSSGARQTVETKIEALHADVLTLLEQLDIPSDYRQAFEDIVQLCLNRDY